MRFSLKWILAGMAYVAIAAAAFSQTTWVYADILWAVSLLAVVYVATVAIFTRGKRQVVATAFVIGSIGFALCLTFGGESVPTGRILAAAGVGAGSPPPWPSAPAMPPLIQPYSPPATAPTYSALIPVPSNPSAGATYYAPQVAIQSRRRGSTPTASVALFPVTPSVDFSIYVRAANAVATLTFGFAGWLIGLAAYRTLPKLEVGEK